jgi:hypothetical protein
MEHYRAAAFKHWSLPRDERTITGWDGIDKLILVDGSRPIKSVEILTELFTFQWTVTGGLCLARFEDRPGESGSTRGTVCEKRNIGAAAVIRRLNNIMIALMSLSYKEVFSGFISFIMEEDEALRFGGDQIAYNFDSAMIKVSNSVNSVTPMKLGDGTEYRTKGSREVARAIMASMAYQVAQMRRRDIMRDQKEDFARSVARQLERSQAGLSEKPVSRAVSQGATVESQDIIKQPQWHEEKKGGKGGGKGIKKEGSLKKDVDIADKKVPARSTYLCVAYLGETLDAMVGELRSKCPKGEGKCYYLHRKANLITRIGADEAMVKLADSAMKQAILRKIAEFTHFKK